MRAFTLFTVALAIAQTDAARVNRTIDDTYGDSATQLLPTYEPVDAWYTGQDCTTCETTPDDRSKIHNGTWHYAAVFNNTQPTTTTVSFTGNAVYVYFVQSPPWGSGPPPWLNSPTSLAGANGTSAHPWLTTSGMPSSNIAFTLDGSIVGTYVASPTVGFQYNVLVYSNASLDNGKHSLSILLPEGSTTGAILFDYIEYTYDDASSHISPYSAMPSPSTVRTPGAQPASKPNTGAIVGTTVGGVLALLFAMLLLFCIRRRRRRTAEDTERTARPFVSITVSRLSDAHIEPQAAAHIAFAPRPATVPEKKVALLAEDCYLASPVSILRSPTLGSVTTLGSTAPSVASRVALTLTIPRARSGTTSTGPLTATPGEVATDSGVRREIDALHNEIERVRAEHAQAHASIGGTPLAYRPASRE